MQRGFINKVKKTYKNIKQDIKGAEIYNGETIEKEIDIREKELNIVNEVKDKKIEISSGVHKLFFIEKYESYNLDVEKTKTSIYSLFEEAQVEIQNVILEEDINVETKTIINYENFPCNVLKKELEEFSTTVLFELVEKSKQAKIDGFVERGFKGRVFSGKDKMYILPKKYKGRSFLGKREMIEIGARVKETKPDFDFREYRFLAIFENLPVFQMKKFRYVEDERELFFYFDKKKKEGLKPMDLVVWSRKNSPLIEKIFI